MQQLQWCRAVSIFTPIIRTVLVLEALTAVVSGAASRAEVLTEEEVCEAANG